MNRADRAKGPQSIKPGKARMYTKPVKPVDSEVMVKVIDHASDPFPSRIKELAEDCGLSVDQTKKLLARAQREGLELVETVKEVKTKQLIGLLEGAAFKSLTLLNTQNKLADASVHDLTILAGVSIDKRQLLSGDPTIIVSTEERQNMAKLMPAIWKEGKRRNMQFTLDQDQYSEKSEAPKSYVMPGVGRTE